MKYAAIIQYHNHDRIPEFRPAHRGYLERLKAEGKLWAAGRFADDSGALIVYEASSEDEVVQLIAHDPFNKAGVFAEYTLKGWNQVF